MTFINFNSTVLVEGNFDGLVAAEIMECEVECTLTSTGIVLDYVYVPQLQRGLRANQLGPKVHTRLLREAFEECTEAQLQVQGLSC